MRKTKSILTKSFFCGLGLTISFGSLIIVPTINLAGFNTHKTKLTPPVSLTTNTSKQSYNPDVNSTDILRNSKPSSDNLTVKTNTGQSLLAQPFKPSFADLFTSQDLNNQIQNQIENQLLQTDGFNKILDTANTANENLPNKSIPTVSQTTTDSSFQDNSLNQLSSSTAKNPKNKTIVDKYFYVENNVLIGLTNEGKKQSNLIIPNSVTEIGYNAFGLCTNLKEVIFTKDSKLEKINGYAFQSCFGLEKITIPESVTKIGEGAFANCKSLKEVNFSGQSKLESISEGAFTDCEVLEEFTIPKNVVKINGPVFYGCTKLDKNPDKVLNYSTILFDWWVKNHLYDGQTMSQMDEIDLSQFTNSAGKNFNVIGDYAFENCTKLTNIIIPKPVKEIGEYAFAYCSNLTNITIPSSVEKIGDNAFSECKNLTSDGVINNSPVLFRWWVINHQYNNKTLAQMIQETNTIDLSQFKNNAGEEFSVIGNSAFENLKLTNITIPESVTEIGKSAFEDCKSLKNIFISNSVIKIGNGAFKGCKKTKFITNIKQLLLNSNSGIFENQIFQINLSLQKQQEFVFFQNPKTNQSGKVILENVNANWDPRLSHLQKNLGQITLFQGFPQENVFQLKITNPQDPNKGKVFTQSPILTFEFTPVFNSVIQNVYHLPKLANLIQDYYNKSTNKDSQNKLQVALDAIKNLQTDYLTVAKWWNEKVINPNNIQVDLPISKPKAEWYTQAQQKLGLKLEKISMDNWKYLLQLTNFRLSQNLNVDLVLGDNVQTINNYLIWDSSRFEFNTIENNVNQGEKFDQANKGQIKLTYLKNNSIDNSYLIPSLENCFEIKLPDNFKLEQNSNDKTVTYTYPYNINPYHYQLSRFQINAQNKYVQVIISGEQPKPDNGTLIDSQIPFKLTITDTPPANPFVLRDQKITYKFDNKSENKEYQKWISQNLFSAEPNAVGFSVVQKQFLTKLSQSVQSSLPQETKLQIVSNNLQSLNPEITFWVYQNQTINLANLDIDKIVINVNNDDQEWKQKIIDSVSQQLKSKLNYQFNYGTDFQITNLADLPFEANTYQLDVTAGDNQDILTGQKSLHIELIINTPKNNLPLILGLGIPFGLVGLGLIIVFAVARFKTRKIL